MTTINFTYNSKNTIIQCKDEDNIKEIFERFCTKAGIDINSVYFLYDGGNSINTNLSVSQVACNRDKLTKSMSILVNETDETNNNPSIIESKEVICPKCGENASIFIEDFKIKIECRAGHKIRNIFFNEFKKTQFIDISKIICNNCISNNKKNSYENKFYRCATCKKNLCPLCRLKHDKNHCITDYELSNYKCEMHGRDYVSFCPRCKKDLCQFCEKAHKEHNLIPLGTISPSYQELKAKVDEIKNKIDKFKNSIEEIIERLNKIKDFMNCYFDILTFIINNYDEKKINYEVICNIRRVTGSKDSNNYIFQELDELNDYEISAKAYKILDIYDKMCVKDLDYITLVYRLNRNEKQVKLFSEYFVENNSNICKTIIGGKERILSEYYNIEDLNPEENQLEIKLKGIKKIKNASWMFFQCSSLISSPDIGDWNTINVVDMGCMFSHFKSLGLPEEISKWNTSNVTNMNNMFYNCDILSLPDISNWDTSKVKDMSHMFSECSSLAQLPDISKWNTSSLIDMEGIFNNCISLEHLPDISKWDTKNVKSMASLFKSCTGLLSLPNISNWDTSNVKNMSYMFYQCSSLKSLPDIANWNTINVDNMSYMFCDCKSLESLPDINKWNIDNVNDKSNMFNNCNNLEKIPSKFRKKFLGIF